MTTKEYIDQFLTDDNVLYIYEFESVIEKQFMADSNSNYIVIGNENFAFNDFNKNIEIYSIQEWFNFIEKGELITFRCNALKPKYVLKEYVSLIPKLNVLNLRNEVGNTCIVIRNTLECNFSNNNIALGKHNLYGAFRLVLWGIKIMINKKIIHLDIPDEYFIDIILNPNNDYKYYEENYLNKLDELLNEFKSYSENEYQKYKRKQIIENGSNKG